ncbi:MAG: hypothetical protein JRI22_19530 [Deltaproteobacteria bacterium]|nr:hypothetical protein [Deltaproteobacteria bacterium]
MPLDEKWSLTNLPPKGHADVADFAYQLFDIAKVARERAGKPKDWLANYALYRGGGSKDAQKKAKTLVNLYFANIERTVANITARNPTGEVVDLDGTNDGAEALLTIKLKKWWKDTNQQAKGRISARIMEIYGIVPEKPVWDKSQASPDILPTDPYGFVPAPGNWPNLDVAPPYICFMYLDYVDKIEKEYNITDVAPDEAYELLGTERESVKPEQSYGNQSVGNYATAMTERTDKGTPSDKKIERGLIVEVWVHDQRTKTETTLEPLFDDQGERLLNDAGEELFSELVTTVPVYPDGVRKITITMSKGETKKSKATSDWMVIDDSPNPNINPALDVALAKTTHPWGRFPVYTANSYKDLVSIWGFSAAEQVGDLILRINQIINKLIIWVLNVMTPPLIVQRNCGITREMIEEQLEKAGRLVLMPSSPNARIEFMQIPNLPGTFFQVLELIVRFFDRVYAMEEADRGQAPKSITAASAIVALQERNQVLMQTKTTAIESLAENKSKWAIGLWQNFGTEKELIEVVGEQQEFLGVAYAGRKFSYVVEAGSTTPRTSLQIQEQAKWLYQTKAIGQRGLLEAINWPGWKEEVERTAESQLDQAFQLLIDAGMPEEMAIQLRNQLLEPQGGPGDLNKETAGGIKTMKPGIPTGSQGGMPPGEVRGE